MPLERRSLEHTLRALGFREEGGDHRFFILYWRERRVVRTKTSRGTQQRTIGERLAAEIAHEMRISRATLSDLVAGTKTKDDYLAELRRQGLLSNP